MDWFEVIVPVMMAAGVVLLCQVLYGGKGGPTHCIGCGKCAADGVCILTGKPVGEKAEKGRERS